MISLVTKPSLIPDCSLVGKETTLRDEKVPMPPSYPLVHGLYVGSRYHEGRR